MDHAEHNGLDKFNRYIRERLVNISKWKYFGLLLDCYFEKKIHGVSIDSYFKYEFFQKNKEGREKFAAGRKLMRFYNACNKKDDCKYFDNKALFLDMFGEFMERDSLDLDKIDYDAFLSFATKNPTVFAKPSGGHFGIGTQKISFQNESDIEKVYNELSGKGYIAEAYINQCEGLSEFNPSSVNSMRVVTFVNKDKTVSVFPYAALRLGRAGNMADNFHFDGIACLVDTENACVIAPGIDQHGNRFVVHPDSKKQIVGFIIPNWEKVCDLVKKAALKCPSVRIVGWDVTITRTGNAVLIEGNSRPDPDVLQAQDQIGKWALLEQFKM